MGDLGDVQQLGVHRLGVHLALGPLQQVLHQPGGIAQLVHHIRYQHLDLIPGQLVTLDVAEKIAKGIKGILQVVGYNGKQLVL